MVFVKCKRIMKFGVDSGRLTPCCDRLKYLIGVIMLSSRIMYFSLAHLYFNYGITAVGFRQPRSIICSLLKAAQAQCYRPNQILEKGFELNALAYYRVQSAPGHKVYPRFSSNPAAPGRLASSVLLH
jgi:hypothetical protein